LHHQAEDRDLAVRDCGVGGQLRDGAVADDFHPAVDVAKPEHQTVVKNIRHRIPRVKACIARRFHRHDNAHTVARDRRRILADLKAVAIETVVFLPFHSAELFYRGRSNGGEQWPA